MAYAITIPGSALEFGASNGSYPSNSCAKIDDTHVINFWNDADWDGRVQVFTFDPESLDLTAEGSSLEFDTTNALYNSCFRIDGTHFINFWQGPDWHGFCQVFEVNTGTWAVTAKGTPFEFYTSQGAFHTCCMVDATHFINFWRGADDDGFCQILEVNTSTWAITAKGSPLEFETSLYAFGSCCLIDSTHVICFWVGPDADGFVQVFEINTSTWAITAKSTPLEFQTEYNGWNSCVKIDSTHVINLCQGDYGYGLIQVYAINASTFAVTSVGTGVQINAPNLTIDTALSQVDSNHFIGFQSTYGGNAYAYVWEVNLSTWNISLSSFKLFYGQETRNACCKMDTNHWVNFWVGSDNKGYTFGFEVRLPLTYQATITGTLNLAGTVNKKVGKIIGELLQENVCDSYSEENYSSGVYLNAWWCGQTFTGNGGILSRVKFYASKAADRTGAISVAVYNHTGSFGLDGIPTGSPIAVSDSLNLEDLSTDFALVEFIFSGVNKIQLNNGTHYVIVAVGISGGYLHIGADNTSPSHSGNAVYSYDGTNFYVDSVDICFYVYTKTTTGNTLGFSGAITSLKKAVRIFEGTLNFTGGITRNIKKSLVGVLNKAGSLSKKLFVTYTGNLILGGVMNKLWRITIEGSLEFRGILSKKASKTFTGTLTMSGVLSAIKYIMYRIISATIKARKSIIDTLKLRKYAP